MRREPDRVRATASRCVLRIVGAAVAAVAILATSATAQRGDLNCDGAFNLVDVGPFVQSLVAPAAYASAHPGCDIQRADINADSIVNGRDVQAFVLSLLAALQTCPPPLTFCNGTCVDTTYNNGHCGACGHICGPDETCIGGICQPSQPCTECD